jgi:hypothetical protein
VLFASFSMIFATGKTNIRNYENVQESIEGIYKDRLVVKGLIYNLASLLHEKELALASKDVTFFDKKNSLVNKEISKNLEDFRETKLTEKEASTLNSFSKSIDQLKIIEREENLSADGALNAETSQKLKSRIESLKEKLKVLSNIQLKEGQQKLKVGSYAVEQMNELALIETIGLIFIGLMMIAIIFIPGPNKKFLWS